MRTFTFLEGMLLFVSVSIGSATNLLKEGTLATVNNNSDGVEGTLVAVIDNDTGRIIEFRVNFDTEGISGVLRIANKRLKSMKDPAIYVLTNREGSVVWLEAASTRDLHRIDGRIYFLRRPQSLYWREHCAGSGQYADIGAFVIRKSQNPHLVILNGEQFPLPHNRMYISVCFRNVIDGVDVYNPHEDLSIHLDGYRNVVFSTWTNDYDKIHFEGLSIRRPAKAFKRDRELFAALFGIYFTNMNFEKIQMESKDIFVLGKKIKVNVFEDGVNIDATELGSKTVLRREGGKSTYTLLCGNHAISKVFSHRMRKRPIYMDLCITTSLF